MSKPLLLSDLPLKPREAEHYFDKCQLQFVEGQLLIERPGPGHAPGARYPADPQTYPQGHYFIYWSTRGEPYESVRHQCLDALAAQAVLFHYCMTYTLQEDPRTHAAPAA